MKKIIFTLSLIAFFLMLSITSLAAVAWQPGINLATQNEAVCGFDGTTVPELFKHGSASGLSIAADPVNTSNRALKLTLSSSDSPYLKIGDFNPIEEDRLIHLSYRYYATTSCSVHFLMKNGAGGNDAVIRPSVFNTQWKSFSFNNALIPAAASSNYGKDSLRLYVLAYKCAATGDTNALYFDDFSMIPYYKIKYYKNDGTEELAKTEQVLFDGESNILTAYTPDFAYERVGYKLLGWSLDRINICTSVPLENADISLYAMWEKVTVPEWGFNTDGDCEGWSGMNSTLSAANGVLTVTATQKPNLSYDPAILISGLKMSGAKYSDCQISLKYLSPETKTGDIIKLYFTGTKFDGTEVELSEANSVSAVILPEYYQSNETVTIDLKLSEKDNWRTSNISSLRIDPLNQSGSVEIDEIRFYKKKNDIIFNFNTDGDAEGWTSQGATASVFDGAYAATAVEKTGGGYDPALILSSQSIKGSDYSKINIRLKYTPDRTKTSDYMYIYYSGTNYDGTDIPLSQIYSASVRIDPVNGSGGEFVELFADMSACPKWSTAVINTIRIDPFNSGGSFEIDSITIPENENLTSELINYDNVTVSYVPDDMKVGRAAGKITLDIGSEPKDSFLAVAFYWAVKNGDGTYTRLPDHRAITTLAIDEALSGFTIKNSRMIPTGANAITYLVNASGDAVGTLTGCDIPQAKLRTAEAPLHKIGVISDIHMGGHGSETAFVTQQINARDMLESLGCEAVCVAGDSTQWYGNYNKIYEWDLIRSYFGSFEIPLFVAQGNHEFPFLTSTEEYLSNGSFSYFTEMLAERISTLRNDHGINVSTVDGRVYYDAFYNGIHYIMLQAPELDDDGLLSYGGFSISDTQIKWLDNMLFQDEKSGVPSIVVGHVPAAGTIFNFYNREIPLATGFLEVFERHPYAMYFTGDSHLSLDLDILSAVDGAGTSGVFVHDGGVININSVDENGELKEVADSMGTVVEIYADRVETKAIGFYDGKWIPLGLYTFDYGEAANFGELTIQNTAVLGNTLTAKLNGEDIGSEYTAAWYKNGEIIGTEKSLYLSSDLISEGEQIAVRITDKNGSFQSDLTLPITAHKRGDVNSDGSLTTFDASLILQRLVNILPDYSANLYALDTDGNNLLTTFDASVILQHIVSKYDPDYANRYNLD